MNRRHFLGLSVGAAAMTLLNTHGADPQNMPEAKPRAQPVIPRRRGFNLTELTGGQRGQSYQERDFQWMAGWGFDFARLPCSYWAWSSPGDWLEIDEAALKPLDEVMELGRRYGVHLNLNLHRIPGYCVNRRELEPHQLFDSPESEMEHALEAAVHHWRFLARRYRDVPSSRLSFDLFNEPPFMPDQSRYVHIAKTLIAAIRSEGPERNSSAEEAHGGSPRTGASRAPEDRLIVADGADIGQTPVLGLVDEGIVQSTRGYLPKMVSHYTATWVPHNEFESFARPTWPMVDRHGVRWDKEKLRQELIVKWQPLVERGVPIHVGEWGCFTATPHDVCLAWMRDLLSLWREAGWGWSMWNLRGGFGIVDSDRPDVKYEDFQGHKLDRRMLELLREG